MSSFGYITATRCEKLQDPDFLNLTVSICILVGLVISYLPQHYRIIERRTSEGISPYFVLLGITSATSAFANILVLPASRADVACCKSVSRFECLAGLLGIAQIGLQWVCFSVILLLFLVFFPRGSTLPPISRGRQPSWRTAIIVALVSVMHGLVVVLISVTLFVTRPHNLGLWANILGLEAAGLAVIQYLPQIYTTYVLGHVGSLSIPMMCIQTPGGFLFAGSLAARLGVEGWSTWGVFLVTGCLQGVLLSMGVYFEIKARRKHEEEQATVSNSQGTGHNESHDNEIETDDEGGVVVENGRSREREPLLKKGKP